MLALSNTNTYLISTHINHSGQTAMRSDYLRCDLYVITACAVSPSFDVGQMHSMRMMTVQWIFSIKARIDRSSRVIWRAAWATALARDVGCLDGQQCDDYSHIWIECKLGKARQFLCGALENMGPHGEYGLSHQLEQSRILFGVRSSSLVSFRGCGRGLNPPW